MTRPGLMRSFSIWAALILVSLPGYDFGVLGLEDKVESVDFFEE